jgi:hypothetical protein
MNERNTYREPIALWERWAVVVVLCIGSMWACYCARLPHLPVNPASRYATMESLVERDTWSIDDSSMRTVDKVFWEGHFYSSKPPLLPLLGAGIYYPLHHWGEFSFRTNKYATVAAMRLPLSVLPWLLGCLFFIRCTHYLVKRSTTRVWSAAAFTLGTLPMSYAACLDNHTWAATSLVGAAWALHPILTDPQGRLPLHRALIGGLAGGGAFAFDLGSGPFVGLIGLAVAWSLLFTGERRQWGALVIFVLAGLSLPAVQAVVLHEFSGSWKPFYLIPEAYQYEGSYWRNPAEFDALSEPRWQYAIHSLVGHHGLFVYSPWLFFGLAWLVQLRETGRGRALQLAVGGALAFVFAYYILRSSNYGGRCVGMRWFMVAVPPLALAATKWVDEHDWLQRHTVGLVALTTFSALACMPGTVNPWEEGIIHALFRAFGAGSVPG